jgi:hypothetical protein
MAVFLSPVGGVAAQFFTNNGVPLSGGKLYTYAAGTTTPAATYTSSSGGTAHANPIVLDSGGRVPGGETWLTDGTSYKFLLKDSTDVLIATYDNIVGINSNYVNFFAQEEIQTATAGQTVFTLANPYVPGANTLSVFVDGVNQYNGTTYSYVETSASTVTFDSGLHVGALVKFTTVQSLTSGQQTDAALVTYTPAGTGAVATTVQAKLRQSNSIKDSGAATTNTAAANTTAIQTEGAASVSYFVPAGTYAITGLVLPTGNQVFGSSPMDAILSGDVTLSSGAKIQNLKVTTTAGTTVKSNGSAASFIAVQDSYVYSPASYGVVFDATSGATGYSNATVKGSYIVALGYGVLFNGGQGGLGINGQNARIQDNVIQVTDADAIELNFPGANFKGGIISGNFFALEIGDENLNQLREQMSSSKNSHSPIVPAVRLKLTPVACAVALI